MKFLLSKIICAVLCAATLLCGGIIALAEPLEEMPLPAPENLVLIANRPVGCTAVYSGISVNDTVMGYINAGADAVIQYDWSVDSADNWNYSAAWDDYALSPMYNKADNRNLFMGEVFWLGTNDIFEHFDAISDSETSEDGAEIRYINFNNHKIYIRARYIVTLADETLISDWSEAQKVIEEEKVGEILSEINPPVLSDLTVNGKEISFIATSDATFKKAQLILEVLDLSGYVIECEITSSEAYITATLPYSEGLNTVNLEDVTLSNNVITTLNARIFHENEPTQIAALDSVLSAESISIGSITEEVSPPEAPLMQSSDAENVPLNNMQIGIIILAVITLCIILAIIIASVGKRRRRHYPW